MKAAKTIFKLIILLLFLGGSYAAFKFYGETGLLAGLFCTFTGGVVAVLMSIRLRKKIDRRVFEVKKLKDLHRQSNRILSLFFNYFDSTFLHITSLVNLRNDTKPRTEDMKGILSEMKQSSIVSNSFLKELDENEEHLSMQKLDEEIEEYFHHANTLTEMLQVVEPKLYDLLSTSIECYNKQDMFKELVVQYTYFSEVINNLVNSVIDNISRTSQPLSDEILNIKMNVNDFITKLNAWQKDFTDSTSQKNFENIMEKYDKQNQDFMATVAIIDGNYNDLKTNIDSITEMINKIYKNSHNIQDLAERIHILSINASIESARAGKYGKGFKVISNEIAKLSENTQSFVNDIVELISESKEQSNKTLANFEKDFSTINEKMNFTKDEFTDFYNILRQYYDDFNTIFNMVSDITSSINNHIGKFNPVFQMHDISIQEMGNVNKIVNKILDANNHNMNIHSIIENTDETKKKQALNAFLDIVESKVTTNSEIKVVNAMIKRYGLDRQVTPDFKSTDEVEFF